VEALQKTIRVFHALLVIIKIPTGKLAARNALNRQILLMWEHVDLMIALASA